MSFILRSRRLLFFVLAVVALGVATAGAALAQETADQPEQPAYASLADILEHEQSRERLISELRRLAGSEGESPPAQAPATDNADADTTTADAADQERVPLARQIAEFTQSVAEGAVGQFRRAIGALQALGDTGPTTATNWSAAMSAALELALVIVATVVLFLVLRRAAGPLFSRASGWALGGNKGSHHIRRVLAVSFAAVVDTVVILLAWVGGYAVALFVLGDAGEMRTQQSLFLNAFLLIEVFKALIRMLFASRYDGLRLLPMHSADAAYWNAWLARLAGFVGYGLLLVVPVINGTLSPALGSLVAVTIMVAAFVYAVAVILRNRKLVRGKLETLASTTDSGFKRTVAALLARTWHLIAIAYFVAFAVLALTRPEEVLPFMTRATLLSLLAIGVGIFVERLLTQAMSREIRVPDETRAKFPLLEARLNSFVPTVLKVLRAVILIVVAALLLHAWNLFDLMAWAASEAGNVVIAAAVSVGFIVIAATLVWIAIASWIEQRLNPDIGRAPTAREETLLALFRNATAIVIVTMTLMICLSEIGINIGPLNAGAGVLGLAIGFGAQSLVQDIITGIFIQLENAINTGDIVTAGSVTGTAERLSIRSVGIRDLAGTFHIVPFSSVSTVSNFMREFAYHVGVYGVAYREDTDEVIEHMQAAFDELRADPAQGPKILADLEVHGVTELADSAVNIRVLIKTLPGTQWGVGRAYNRVLKRHFDAAGIEISFPHLTVYFGESKDGTAAPVRVRALDEPSSTAGKSDQ